MKGRLLAALLAAAAIFSAGCGKNAVVNGIDVSDASVQSGFAGKNIGDLASGHTDGGDPVHDPSIIRDPDTGTYWLFGTHMELAKSDDMVHWTKVFSGESRYNKLFANLFADDSDAFDWVGRNEDGGYSVWAPCVIYNKAMQKYCMYFCTSSTYIKSSLCLAVSDSIKGPYEYKGRLLDSGFNRMDAKKGLVDILDYYDGDIKAVQQRYLKGGAYNNLEWPNCIDPTVFYDENGKMWMVYGSWSGGIFLLEIDEDTGLVIHPETDEENDVDCYYGKHLLGGNHQSIEGPWIQYDSETGYYYLFVSYGALQAHGGYQIRLFRSENPDGPYVDAMGETPGGENHEDYGIKMIGNYTFPSLDVTYMAPGHNSMLQDSDGKRYLIYHQRFDDGTENFEPRVHQMFVNADGWYVAAPFETSGETLPEQGYSLQDVCGTYYIVNHGLDISDQVPDTKAYALLPDGNIYSVASDVTDAAENNKALAAEAETSEEKAVITNSTVPLSSSAGTFSQTPDTPYASLTIGSDTFQGVFIEMKDEAGNPCMCFTGSSKEGETLFGVHYETDTDS